MSETNKIASNDSKNNYQRLDKSYKIGYVVVIEDGEGHIQDTPFASFDRGLAEETALEYAWELLWENWYWFCHGPCDFLYNSVSIYDNELTDFYVYVKEIKWYG